MISKTYHFELKLHCHHVLQAMAAFFAARVPTDVLFHETLFSYEVLYKNERDRLKVISNQPFSSERQGPAKSRVRTRITSSLDP